MTSQYLNQLFVKKNTISTFWINIFSKTIFFLFKGFGWFLWLDILGSWRAEVIFARFLCDLYSLRRTKSIPGIHWWSQRVQGDIRLLYWKLLKIRFQLSWMIPILLRDLIFTILICGFWDWLLYFSPLKKNFEKFKINKGKLYRFEIQNKIIRVFTE